MYDIFIGIMVPFIGTSLGAACVFFMKGRLNGHIQRVLMGFAAGVMTAASVWSLILPALEQSDKLGRLAFLPAVLGFCTGVLFLLLLDYIIPQPCENGKKTSMLVLAVTLHNIPEGMAVGIVYAGLAAGAEGISNTAALALAAGIAVQNFPEGAIISMPLRADGASCKKAFAYGVLSGAVEPLAAVLTVAASHFILPAMPYLLSFAAGAMLYVVVEELIPEMARGKRANTGAIYFAVGFAVMMALDVALG